MSRSELEAREVNKLFGGLECCICTCFGYNTSLAIGGGLGIDDGSGYDDGTHR